MKDHRQIDGLIRQMTECLENAYNRGYKQGNDCLKENIQTHSDNAYEQGLKDAWGCARLIELDENEGGLDVKTIKEIFGMNYHQVFLEYSASEAIAKIREFREKHTKEIKVGDEVYSETYGEKGVVTKVWDNSDIIILSSNSSMIRTPKNKVKKTGKHYDEMEQLLEKMRGE